MKVLWMIQTVHIDIFNRLSFLFGRLLVPWWAFVKGHRRWLRSRTLPFPFLLTRMSCTIVTGYSLAGILAVLFFLYC